MRSGPGDREDQSAEPLARRDGPRRQASTIQATLEKAASALDADVVSLVCKQSVVAASPTRGHRPPGWRTELSEEGHSKPRRRRLVVAVGTDAAFSLVAERVGEEFTAEDRDVLATLAGSLTPWGLVMDILAAEQVLRSAYESQKRDRASISAKFERQHAFLQQLLRIQRLISALTPLNSILDEVVSAATALIGDEVGNIRLQDPQRPDRLVLAGRVSEPSAAIARVESIRPGEGATGRAFSEERLIVAEDYARSAGAIPVYSASKVEACMAAPVRQNGRVVGVMVVATQRKGRRYTAEEQEILLAFAEHASLALTDAQRVSAVEHMAFHDTLTGLPNRAHFMERLKQALDRARSAVSPCVAVLFIDIDHFKKVNDSLGHAAGDTVLGVIGRRLVESIRTDDVAARLGGDEFAVLLEDANRDDTLGDVVRRILSSMEATVQVGDHTIPITASVGTATSDGSHDASELLRNADLAMYRAKAQGRCCAADYEAASHVEVLPGPSLGTEPEGGLDP